MKSLTSAPRQFSSLLVLIAANIFPILGVFFFDYDVFSILLLYWTESGVVGFYWIIKLMLTDTQEITMNVPQTKGAIPFAPGVYKLLLIPFFIIHFGIFMMVHLFILVFFFGMEGSFLGFGIFRFLSGGFLQEFIILWPGILLLFISHGYSLLQNYLRRDEHVAQNVQTIMFQPYRRIIIMHLVLVFGGFLIIATSQTIVLLILLICIKIGVDAIAHVKERQRFQNSTT